MFKDLKIFDIFKTKSDIEKESDIIFNNYMEYLMEAYKIRKQDKVDNVTLGLTYTC